MERTFSLHTPSVDEIFRELSDLCEDVTEVVSPSDKPQSPLHHVKDHNERLGKWFTRLGEERRSRSHSPRTRECGTAHDCDSAGTPA